MEESVHERGPMVSLGSVVHNPQVVERLRDEGLDVVTDVSEVAGRPVAITAHGVSQQVISDLESNGVEIIDTTCPIVTRSQQWARRLTEEGFALIVFGDPNHKEVRGVSAGPAATSSASPPKATLLSCRQTSRHASASCLRPPRPRRGSPHSSKRCSRSTWTGSASCACSTPFTRHNRAAGRDDAPRGQRLADDRRRRPRQRQHAPPRRRARERASRPTTSKQPTRSTRPGSEIKSASA